MKSEFYRDIQSLGFEPAYRIFMENHPEGTIPNHVADHFFGSYLFATKGLSGLSYCKKSHGEGCEHSIYLSEMLYIRSTDSAGLRDVCTGIYASDSCWHALGHAAIVKTDPENVQSALTVCKTANSTSNMLQCVNGIFMQHFMPALFLPDSDLPLYRPFDTTKPYDICLNVPDEVTPYCVEELVVWWRSLFFNNYSTVSLLCSGLPEEKLKTYCYTAMGADAAYTQKERMNAADSICAIPVDDMYKKACKTGAESYTHPSQNLPMKMQ